MTARGYALKPPIHGLGPYALERANRILWVCCLVDT